MLEGDAASAVIVIGLFAFLGGGLVYGVVKLLQSIERLIRK